MHALLKSDIVPHFHECALGSKFYKTQTNVFLINGSCSKLTFSTFKLSQTRLVYQTKFVEALYYHSALSLKCNSRYDLCLYLSYILDAIKCYTLHNLIFIERILYSIVILHSLATSYKLCSSILCLCEEKCCPLRLGFSHARYIHLYYPVPMKNRIYMLVVVECGYILTITWQSQQ